MRTDETLSGLAEFERRGAGTDAERRAARWLGQDLGGGGREVLFEPFWCRPNWALAHAWHVALGLAGSLLSVSAPGVGAALILVALLSVFADALLGASPGRRLTPERASQNVVGLPPGTGGSAHVRLIITANYDAGRMGLAYRDLPRAAAARLRELTHGLTPGWLGWLAIALAWLEVVAIIRIEGSGGTAVGAAQLIPTVALVLALALLLDLASADFGPGGGDNGSGVAVAIALARALDAAPPRRTAVEVVLEGAGDGSGIGLRRFLQRHKRELRPANTVVLGIAACSAGAPRWWVSDGALVPLGYFGRLRELCAAVSRDDAELGARPHRARGRSPALPARIARLPAITIGSLDQRGLVPRSHQSHDTAEEIDAAAVGREVEFGLLLVDAIDGFLGKGATKGIAGPGVVATAPPEPRRPNPKPKPKPA
jgi:hypothetical protein